MADQQTDETTEPTRDGSVFPRRTFMKGVGVAGVTAMSGQAAARGQEEQPARKRKHKQGFKPAQNGILFIADGQGPTQISAARYLDAYQANQERFPLNVDPAENALNQDHFEARGVATTFPDDPTSLVTDSAAAATAMASGVKTYNGAIGGVRNQNGDFVPTRTVLEAAHDQGLATGLVVTSRLTHATPAAFAAHVPDRGQEEEIARQYIEESGVDVLLGGGRRYFEPAKRSDGKDLIAAAEDRGYTYVETATELADVNDGPLLGLFSPSSHMNFALDRQPSDDTTQPELVEMVDTALSILRQNKDGFFLMIEASRVDHAGHANDPAIVAEQLEADATMGRVLEFTQSHKRKTTVVSTADHETGGLSLGRDGVYNFDLDVIDSLQASAEVLAPAIDSASSDEEIQSIVSSYTNIDDLTQDELDRLDATGAAIKAIISERALLGWTSGGHTGVDVPTLASGPNAEFFDAARDNTTIADVFAGTLDLSNVPDR